MSIFCLMCLEHGRYRYFSCTWNRRYHRKHIVFKRFLMHLPIFGCIRQNTNILLDNTKHKHKKIFYFAAFEKGKK